MIRKYTIPWHAGIFAVAFTACSEKGTENNDMMNNNPILAEWKGPYGGVPDFDKVDVADLQAAMEAGIASHLEEIDAIARNPETPTFDNTLLAMEKSGEPIKRAF